jgi:hypothetical protein
VPLDLRCVAKGALGVLVWSLAIPAPGAVHADPMAVIEIYDRSLVSLAGLFFGQLIDDCDDPAVLLHSPSVERS